MPLSQAKGFMQNRSIGFEENKGQVTGDDANRVKFILKDDNLSLFLLNDGIAYQFNRIHYPEGYSNANLNETVEQQQKRIDLSKDIRIETYRMDVQLVGANPNPRITTDGESKDYVQYYTHNALNVHNYSKVTYHDIYPNIDWVIYSKDGQVKYDFIVRPGGNPDQIKLASNWVEDLKLNEDGSLTMKNRMGVITEKAPISFQGSRGIKTQFVVKNGTIGFNLGDYSKDILEVQLAIKHYLVQPIQGVIFTFLGYQILSILVLLLGGIKTLSQERMMPILRNLPVQAFSSGQPIMVIQEMMMDAPVSLIRTAMYI